ncbi:MAG: hypothetical protein VCC00_06850 [Deltaproteobacteria bacterium]
MSGGDPEDAEVEAILEGRDSIVLDGELTEEAPATQDPSVPVVRREALTTRIRRMPVPERLKAALRGNHEARNVLARDPVKLVQGAVLKNPRITVEEVLNIAKSRSVQGDLLRRIAAQREWVRQYSIRQALVLNPKTPLTVSLALLGGLRERDVQKLARSRNIPGVIQQAARRLLAQRGR